MSFCQMDGSAEMNVLKSRIPFFTEDEEKDCFFFQNIRIYLKDFGEDATWLYAEDADYVIMDFGVLGKDFPKDFIRADEKIIIINQCAWKHISTEAVLNSCELFKKGKWILAALPYYLDEVKEVKRAHGFNVHPMPYISNPFSLKKKEISELEKYA